MEKLVKLIKLLIRKELSQHVSVGKATNINKSARTCDIVLSDDITIYDCRLNAITDNYNNHVLILPKENSYVSFTLIENQSTNVLVIGYSEIDEIDIRIEKQSLLATKDGFVFNEGKYEGIVIADKLVNDLKSYSDAITSLQNALNAFIPAGTIADGGTLAGVLKAALTSYQSPTFTDIKNDKIKH